MLAIAVVNNRRRRRRIYNDKFRLVKRTERKRSHGISLYSCRVSCLSYCYYLYRGKNRRPAEVFLPFFFFCFFDAKMPENRAIRRRDRILRNFAVRELAGFFTCAHRRHRRRKREVLHFRSWCVYTADVYLRTCIRWEYIGYPAFTVNSIRETLSRALGFRGGSNARVRVRPFSFRPSPIRACVSTIPFPLTILGGSLVKRARENPETARGYLHLNIHAHAHWCQKLRTEILTGPKTIARFGVVTQRVSAIHSGKSDRFTNKTLRTFGNLCT